MRCIERAWVLVGVASVTLLQLGGCHTRSGHEGDESPNDATPTGSLHGACLEADIHDQPIRCVDYDLRDSEQLSSFEHACDAQKASTAMLRHYSWSEGCPDLKLGGCQHDDGFVGVDGIVTEWQYAKPLSKCTSDATAVAGDAPIEPEAIAVEPSGPCADWCKGQCVQDRCLAQVVAPKRGNQPTSLAFDDDSIYWLEDAGGAADLRSLPLVGGTAKTLATLLASSVISDGNNLYWSEGNDFAPGAIFSLPVAGGEESRVAEPWQPGNLSIAGGMLYFTSGTAFDNQMDERTKGGIGRVAVGGGELELLTTFDSGEAWEMVIDDERAYFVKDGTTLASMPLDGGDVTELAQVENARSLRLHDGELYFVSNGLSIDAIPAAGGDVRHVADAAGSNNFAIDPSGVYFASYAGLSRVALDGGAPEVLVTDQKRPTSVAVHEGALYWIVEPEVPSSEYSLGAIMKLWPL